jgi:NAD(P)-dependent dehydrogenase (short-subunit alcohol dehydrogenase family)
MVPLLRKGTNAAVVNTSSVYGPSGGICYAAYGASKSGVLGLTRTAALDWADAGIRVNALLTGGVLTAMNEGEHSGGVLDEAHSAAARTSTSSPPRGRVPGKRRRQLRHRLRTRCRRRLPHR